MKKTVKCVGCGKEHEIQAEVREPKDTDVVDITFISKPVDSIFQKLLNCRDAKIATNDGYPSAVYDDYPQTVYIGKLDWNDLADETCLLCDSNVFGFDIVIVDMDRYFAFGE